MYFTYLFIRISESQFMRVGRSQSEVELINARFLQYSQAHLSSSLSKRNT